MSSNQQITCLLRADLLQSDSGGDEAALSPGTKPPRPDAVAPAADTAAASGADVPASERHRVVVVADGAVRVPP